MFGHTGVSWNWDNMAMSHGGKAQKTRGFWWAISRRLGLSYFNSYGMTSKLGYTEMDGQDKHLVPKSTVPWVPWVPWVLDLGLIWFGWVWLIESTTPNILGFPIVHGDTPIAGWFISWNIHLQNWMTTRGTSMPLETSSWIYIRKKTDSVSPPNMTRWSQMRMYHQHVTWWGWYIMIYIYNIMLYHDILYIMLYLHMICVYMIIYVVSWYVTWG